MCGMPSAPDVVYIPWTPPQTPQVEMPAPWTPPAQQAGPAAAPQKAAPPEQGARQPGGSSAPGPGGTTKNATLIGGGASGISPAALPTDKKSLLGT